MTILELAQQHRDAIIEAHSRPVYDNTPPVVQPKKPKTLYDVWREANDELFQP